MLRGILENHNFAVIATISGKQALELARQQLPQLIILDMEIPDLNGAKVAQILSEDPVTADIPIIFLTGMAAQEQSGVKPGQRYLLAKPVTAETLLDFVGKALSSKDNK